MFASWPSARALQPHPCVEDLPRYRLHRQLPRHFTASFASASKSSSGTLAEFLLGLGVWLVEVHRSTGEVCKKVQASARVCTRRLCQAATAPLRIAPAATTSLCHARVPLWQCCLAGGERTTKASCHLHTTATEVLVRLLGDIVFGMGALELRSEQVCRRVQRKFLQSRPCNWRCCCLQVLVAPACSGFASWPVGKFDSTPGTI